MASNPIADAHEERAQRVEGEGDADDEEFSSHGSILGFAFAERALCSYRAGARLGQ